MCQLRLLLLKVKHHFDVLRISLGEQLAPELREDNQARLDEIVQLSDTLQALERANKNLRADLQLYRKEAEHNRKHAQTLKARADHLDSYLHSIRSILKDV